MNPHREPMLVTPAWLAARLDSPRIRILECSTHLHPRPVGPSRVVSGLPEFELGHIPRAQYANMATDLSDPDGRYPYTLPGEELGAHRLGALGIGNEHHVVLYARGGMMSAARVWFVMHALGHPSVSILDGGYEAWLREGLPVESRVFQPPACRFTARLIADRVANRADVERALSEPRTRLVNALSREQFLGIGGAHYGRPGSIPGSVSVPARELIDPADGRLRPLAQLREAFALAGVMDAPRVIVYCGGGVAASVVAFALEMLEHPGWSLYDNSLLEWSTQPELPMQAAGED